MSSTEKWEVIVNELQDNKKKKIQMTSAKRDIVFQYTYPRLDDHVSTGVNHLLKSPFCVHPKTGRVCVPIDPKNCDSFNPFKVPTLQQLIQELDEIVKNKDTSPAGEGEENSETKDLGHLMYEKTSLKPYIELFRKFLSGLDTSLREELRKKRLESDKDLLF